MKLEVDSITIRNIVKCKTEILQAFDAGDRELDFAEVRVFDSAALALMLGLMRRYPDVAFRNVPSNGCALIDLYGLNALFTRNVLNP